MNEMPNKFYNPIKTKIRFKAIKICSISPVVSRKTDGWKEGMNEWKNEAMNEERGGTGSFGMKE